jgi:hypothetical protein
MYWVVFLFWSMDVSSHLLCSLQVLLVYLLDMIPRGCLIHDH